MITVQFFENSVLVLSQLRKQIPAADEEIKIKGRKGKVLAVKEINDQLIHVTVSLDKPKKNQLLAADNKKKKR